jgi:hypothetical protein
MPNYIKNRLVINGTNEQIEEVKNFLRPKEPTQWKNQEESVAMDFNNITPMPKWVYQGDLGRIKEEKYGKENCWFEWCRKNWGTKWNAFSSSSYDNIIEFETAWNGVPELITKLGVIFPDIEFEYLYADEDIGYNVGHYKFKDTEIDEAESEQGSKEAYELAFDLWGCKEDYEWNEEKQKYEFTQKRKKYLHLFDNKCKIL